MHCCYLKLLQTSARTAENRQQTKKIHHEEAQKPLKINCNAFDDFRSQQTYGTYEVAKWFAVRLDNLKVQLLWT
jgi:hypothetical protein